MIYSDVLFLLIDWITVGPRAMFVVVQGGYRPYSSEHSAFSNIPRGYVEILATALNPVAHVLRLPSRASFLVGESL